MKTSQRFKVNHGFTLLEVLIAVTILGIVGLTMLNSLQSNESLTAKNSEKVLNFNFMTSAAEIVAKEEFVSCNATSGVNPYDRVNTYLASVGSPVRIIKVEGQVPEENGSLGKVWRPCGDNYWNTVKRTPMLQRITLRNSAISEENPYQRDRVIFKNLIKAAPSAPSVVVSENSSGGCASPLSSLNVLAGYEKPVYLYACDSSGASVPGAVFFTPPGSGLKISTTSCLSNFASSTGNFALRFEPSTYKLSLCPNLAFLPNPASVIKQNIEIAAVDSTGNYYNGTTLNAIVYHPPKLVNLSTQFSAFGSTGRFICAESLSSDLAFRLPTPINRVCNAMPIAYDYGIPEVPVSYGIATGLPSGATASTAPLPNLSDKTGGITSSTATAVPSSCSTSSSPTPQNFNFTFPLTGGGIPVGQSRASDPVSLSMKCPMRIWDFVFTNLTAPANSSTSPSLNTLTSYSESSLPRCSAPQNSTWTGIVDCTIEVRTQLNTGYSELSSHTFFPSITSCSPSTTNCPSKVTLKSNTKQLIGGRWVFTHTFSFTRDSKTSQLCRSGTSTNNTGTVFTITMELNDPLGPTTPNSYRLELRC